MAASPPKRMVAEGPTGMVRSPAAKTSIPRSPRAAALATWFPRQPEMGSELTKEPPESKALGLEVPCAAKERPSCGGNPSTPMVPSRSVLHEAASGGNTPRHSAGRPERSADDPQRNPRGGPWGGPARSAKEPWMPSKAIQDKAEGKGAGKPRLGKAKRPTIITVDENGLEKKWGPLSGSSAWRAGSFWEEMNQKVKVFLEKDGKRNEVHVEKRIQGGRICFWFDENIAQPPQQPQECEVDDETETVEEATGVEEVTPDEMQKERMMWLTEKAATIENEKEELKRVI